MSCMQIKYFGMSNMYANFAPNYKYHLIFNLNGSR